MGQGAWGVVPVHLNELSPPQFRAAFPGITYQIGNAISSPAAEIETGLPEHHKITYKGKQVEAFRPVMGIATSIIAATLAFGPRLGRGTRQVISRLLMLPDTRTESLLLDPLLGLRTPRRTAMMMMRKCLWGSLKMRSLDWKTPHKFHVL